MNVIITCNFYGVGNYLQKWISTVLKVPIRKTKAELQIKTLFMYIALPILVYNALGFYELISIHTSAFINLLNKIM